jgi:hypothetical protein
MRLSVAAGYFDRLVCQDAFNSSATFKGQLDVFDDSKRDGLTVARRILSTQPSVVIPARRVIVAGGETWIVGGSQSDNYNGSVLRTKYVLHRAHGAATIKSVAQVLGTAGGVNTYGSKLWVKDLKEVETSSKLSGFFNVYLPTPDAIAPGNIITLLGRQHLVRNAYLSATGFNVAECDELAARRDHRGHVHADDVQRGER